MSSRRRAERRFLTVDGQRFRVTPIDARTLAATTTDTGARVATARTRDQLRTAIAAHLAQGPEPAEVSFGIPAKRGEVFAVDLPARLLGQSFPVPAPALAALGVDPSRGPRRGTVTAARLAGPLELQVTLALHPALANRGPCSALVYCPTTHDFTTPCGLGEYDPTHDGVTVTAHRYRPGA